MVSCLVCGQKSPSDCVDVNDISVHDAPDLLMARLNHEFEVIRDMSVFDFALKLEKANTYQVGSHDLYLIDDEGTVLGHKRKLALDEICKYITLKDAIQAAIDNPTERTDEEATELANKKLQIAIGHYEAETDYTCECSESKAKRCLVYKPKIWMKPVHHPKLFVESL